MKSFNARKNTKSHKNSAAGVQRLTRMEMDRVHGGGRSEHAVMNDGYLYYGYYDIMVIED